jgi:DnaK suppressor protein
VAKKATKKVAVAKKPAKHAKASAGHSSRRVSNEVKPGSAGTGENFVKPARLNKSSEPALNMPVPIPVPTDGKPRKNQAGMSPRELEHFRELLLGKRRELVGDMGQMEREALRSAGGTNLSNLPLHMADMGTDNYEQEFTLGLVEKERNLLREINQALAKIQDGTYGICEGTGKPISKARLEAQPWARFSIEYARQKEQGYLR